MSEGIRNMKTNMLWIIFAAALAGTCTAQIDMDKLETSLETLKNYHYDKTQGVDLVWVEAQVGMASADKTLRARVETQLLDSLAGAKSNDARQFFCRQLRTVGTARSVPQLEAMLTNAEISHMARYALGRIRAPQAGQALEKALGKTSGKLKAGMINTLVQANFYPAASELMKLIHDRDTDVAVAAIRATGHFGGGDAVKALQRMRPSASQDTVIEIDAAILACARRFASRGNRRSAAAIYQEYYINEYPEYLRIAGLRGLVETSGAKAVDVLAKAIKGEDANMRSSAIAMMAVLRGEKITHTLVTLSKVVPANGQALIVRALAARHDVSVVPAVMDLTNSDHDTVRMAAFEALGDIGTPQAIACLAKAAALSPEKEARIAQSSLVRMRGEGVDQAFIREINSGDPKPRIEVVKAIGQRLDHDPFDALYAVAKADTNTPIRREAISSMGRIGRPLDLDALVKLVVSPHHPGDRSAVDQAIAAVCHKMENRDAQADPILAALATAPDDAKVFLLRLLARPATTKALQTVQAAITSPNNPISDAAIRTLGEWPNPAPVDTLYEIASSSANQIHRILSLRGFIRLAALTQNPTTCYVNALKLAKRPEEIRLVLGGLHYAGTLQALELAESYMTDPALKAEACMAAAKVAGVYCWQDRVRAKTVLDRVIAEAPNDNIRNQARDVLRRMDAFKSIIAVWKGAGPFTLAGISDGRRVFDTAFEPETDFDAPEINWRIIVPEFEGSGRIDLEKTYGRIDYCCAYLRTTVISPRDQQARLKWGVDDFIKGWLNGKATGDGQITLRKGANTFILKVGDHGGGWNFRCEILQPDETPLKGLRFER